MSYIDITSDILKEYDTKNYNKNILVIAPGFKITKSYRNIVYTTDISIANIVNNDTYADLSDLNSWIINHIVNDGRTYDFIFASRILEHLPYRNIDYYLYNIYNIMNKDGLFISIVPDMDAITDRIREEYKKNQPNYFLISRLNFEMFAEGEHHYDFHKTYTSFDSITNLLTREKLFVLEKIDFIRIETDIIPPYIICSARRA